MANVKSLSGAIVNAGGSPLVAVPVTLMNDDSGATLGSTATNADGEWTFANQDETIRYRTEAAIGGAAEQVAVRKPASVEFDHLYVNTSLRTAAGATVALGGAITVAGSPVITEATGDTRYVNVGGDTMTGGLTVSAGGLAVTGASTVTGTLGVTSTLTASAAATVGTTLTVNSRAVIMAGCRVWHNATQSIASGTPTALAFTSERYDTDAFHDTSTNTSRLTVPAGLAGKYLIKAHVAWAAAAGGVRQQSLRVNGSTLIADTTIAPPGAFAFSMPPLVTTYDLAVGDYVEIVVTQSTGGALNVITSANISPEFGMQRVG